MKCGLLIGLSCLLMWATQVSAAEMVRIPSGKYTPFYPPSKKNAEKLTVEKRVQVKVDSFWMDRYAVTRGEFLRFVLKNPKWQKSQMKEIFSDSHYLSMWQSDESLPAHQSALAPVTEVSWFAAQAYCRSQGKSLPTVDQWEYVASDQGRGNQEAQKRILEWYSHPNTNRLPKVGSTGKNSYGVYDLHGLIWEWTLDFNNAMMSEESRENGTTDGNLFAEAEAWARLIPPTTRLLCGTRLDQV
jgi:formylglycine-generating enzyme required for sulfatase activity